jgi:hypothetical protein
MKHGCPPPRGGRDTGLYNDFALYLQSKTILTVFKYYGTVMKFSKFKRNCLDS